MKNSIIKYRNSIIALLMIVLNGVGATASTSWTVNPSDYRYDMSLYLDMNFVSGPMDYSQYDVAVFCGDECRGTAERLSLGDGKECLYLRTRSNQESGEKMTFRYYNKTTDEILPVDGVSFNFESNGRLGYPSEPYIVKIILHYDVSLSAGEGGSINQEGGRIAENTELTISATPAEGRHFEKWSDGNTENPRTVIVNENITLTAEFGINSYKLVYNVDGESYREYDIDYGTAIIPEAMPEKEGHTFSGWEGLPETMPAKDVTVRGSFSVNSYNATFKIGDEVIEIKPVVFAQPVTAPEAPEKEGHTFTGWQNVPETMPSHDIEITGSYKVNSYKLTYLVDDETYKSLDIDYGTAVTPEALPEKEGHTFSGWEGLPETMPAKDVTVSGSFSVNSYNATFKIGDEVIETKTVVFAQPVTAPEVPEKEGHTFAGWQNVPETMPSHDIEITGSYKVNSYKLTYLVDGETYKTLDVDYGTAIIPEAMPEKEGHTFSGWEGLPETMPAKDVTVRGSFSVNSYNATFKIGDLVIETKTVVFAQPVTAPEVPEKEGHTFAGWQNVPETMPAHDIEITGSYKVNSYKLTYLVDGETYKTLDVDYGTAVTPEALPEKEGYTFSGWEGLPETMPAKDVTVSGSFSVNSYKLTVYLDGDVYYDEMIEYGASISIPEPEIPDDKLFDGWNITVPETMPAYNLDIYGTTSDKSGIHSIFADDDSMLTVYNIKGVLIYRNIPVREAENRLTPGLYIINGKKVLIK